MNTSTDSYISTYLAEVQEITSKLSALDISYLVEELVQLRARKGRLFFLGVGGSAGNASHAVNDFRKIAAIESYAPTDNVSELTARINDDGWDSAYAKWLQVSQLGERDAVFVLSVGGGNEEKQVSVNLIQAMKHAREVGARVLGIVGRDGGYTRKVADCCIVVPTVNSETITPHTEAFQAVIWHLIVSHPKILANAMKWESVT